MDNKHRLAEDFLRPLAPEDEMRDELFGDLRAEAASSNQSPELDEGFAAYEKID